MVAEGPLTYQQALALVNALKENGIDANITVGGVSVDPKQSQVNMARDICKAHNAVLQDGNRTTQMALILMGNEYDNDSD